MDLQIRAPRMILGDRETSGTVWVRDGVIAAVGGFDVPATAARAREVITLEPDVVLLPGLVDTHVHINEPGHADWEGFATATLAAAAGGVTTLVDMPLDSLPVTTSVEALRAKQLSAAGQLHVDVGMWGGAVPGNTHELPALHRAGVRGFKCFLVDSGTPAFPPLSPDELVEAMRVVRELDAVLLVHAEDPRSEPVPHGPCYGDFLAARPAMAEAGAVATVIDAVRRTGARAHIVHLSSAAALPLIEAARRDGLPVTAETCPHYLALTAEEIPDGATEFACLPPIREAANAKALWAALAGGVLSAVVSDHSPATVEAKRTGDFGTAWGGISSLQLSLPVLWTAARERGFTLVDVVRWMSTAPARLARFPGLGRIAPGCPANLSAFAPDEDFVVHAEDLHHRQPVTAYDGRKLRGVVRRTWLRGQNVHRPLGRLL